jgi:hypothetical protein
MTLCLYVRSHAAHETRERVELRLPCWNLNTRGEESQFKSSEDSQRKPTERISLSLLNQLKETSNISASGMFVCQNKVWILYYYIRICIYVHVRIAL